MLISFEKKFVFIHNPKCGGSSINESFRHDAIYNAFKLKFVNVLLEKKSLYEIPIGLNLWRKPVLNNLVLPSHVTATMVSNWLGADWDDFFTFGFVRHPLSLHVSMYFYTKQSKNHPYHDTVVEMSFKQYVDWKLRHNLELQTDYFYEKSNRIVDYIGKVETMKQSFMEVCDLIGIKRTLLRKNHSDHKHYLEYYDYKLAKKVYHKCKKDYVNFGYDSMLKEFN